LFIVNVKENTPPLGKMLCDEVIGKNSAGQQAFQNFLSVRRVLDFAFLHEDRVSPVDENKLSVLGVGVQTSPFGLPAYLFKSRLAIFIEEVTNENFVLVSFGVVAIKILHIG
jgi:hypothetical protein